LLSEGVGGEALYVLLAVLGEIRKKEGEGEGGREERGRYGVESA
jgi:hypothetical protein